MRELFMSAFLVIVFTLSAVLDSGQVPSKTLYYTQFTFLVLTFIGAMFVVYDNINDYRRIYKKFTRNKKKQQKRPKSTTHGGDGSKTRAITITVTAAAVAMTPQHKSGHGSESFWSLV